MTEMNDLISERPLSSEIKTIIDKSILTPTTVSELLGELGSRGFALLPLFLVIPFLQPVPLPFFSLPFGIIIFFSGLTMAFTDRLWLPKRILAYKINPESSKKIATAALKILPRIERIVKPRLQFLSTLKPFKIINGLLMAFFGFLVALPIPIPATNLVPAVLILILAIGILEKDGLFILLDYLIFSAMLLLVSVYFPHLFSYINSIF